MRANATTTTTTTLAPTQTNCAALSGGCRVYSLPSSDTNHARISQFIWPNPPDGAAETFGYYLCTINALASVFVFVFGLDPAPFASP